MRLGIYGGSFDPVHYAHLLLAETCREQAQLDEVWFVPNSLSPLKRSTPPASAKHRQEMLLLAIGGNEAFRLCSKEIDRGGVSFTVDTLEEIHAEHPHHELFFLLGADSLHDLPLWRSPERICELALPLVVQRHGSPTPDFTVLDKLLSPERMAQAQSMLVHMPLVDLSSTDLRQRAAEGRSLRYRTPRAVERYIETQGLYRSEPPAMTDRGIRD
jgi:nicotinate-nucleotide adenylyltransferase